METQAQKINTVWKEFQESVWGGVVYQYRNGRIGGNVGTLAVDNVKLTGGLWLKYRIEVAWVLEVVEIFTEGK